MVSMSASVDGAQADAMTRALKAYGDAMGSVVSNAPKAASLAVCDSLRSRTKSAPKYARSSEYAASLSPNPPRYITYRNHQKLPIALHRWRLTRKLGTPDEYTRDLFVYSHIKRTKKGEIVGDLTAEKRELKQFHLENFHRGLAKTSWNWVKREIRTGTKAASWKRRKGDVRNPGDSVSGSYRKSKGTLASSGRAEIHNHLDYINAALKPMALDESMRAGARKLAFAAAMREGMSPDEAARYARELASEFVHV